MHRQRPSTAFVWASLVPVVLLVAAGLVLASSWFVAWPQPVLSAAWLLAVVGLVAAAIAGWRRARSEGRGPFGALGRSLRAVGRFIVDFF